MDFTLLYAAKAASKSHTRLFRIALAASIGAAFAIVYPLIGVERLHSAAATIAGISVKLIIGLSMCAVSCKFKNFKAYLKFTGFFAGFCFLLGGALFALFSMGKVQGVKGGYITSVPIGIPLFFALVLIISVKRAVKKFKGAAIKKYVVCKIWLGGNSAKLPAFYDSGNNVYFSGSPVSIIPRSAAKKLIDTGGIKTFTHIHTVSGNGKVAVFKADRVEIDDGKAVEIREGVMLGISPSRITKMVMHPDLAEVN